MDDIRKLLYIVIAGVILLLIVSVPGFWEEWVESKQPKVDVVINESNESELVEEGELVEAKFYRSCELIKNYYIAPRVDGSVCGLILNPPTHYLVDEEVLENISKKSSSPVVCGYIGDAFDGNYYTDMYQPELGNHVVVTPNWITKPLGESCTHDWSVPGEYLHGDSEHMVWCCIDEYCSDMGYDELITRIYCECE